MSQNEAKSLKDFIKESSIIKEVKTWTVYECEEYIKKHKGEKHSSLLKKKLRIVDIISKIKQVVAQDANGEKRKELLKGVSVEYLIDYAPPNARDPKGKKIGRHQKNTGIYLWKRGYNPEKFLGAGSNGVVWKCDNKAIKVTCNKKNIWYYHS